MQIAEFFLKKNQKEEKLVAAASKHDKAITELRAEIRTTGEEAIKNFLSGKGEIKIG